MKAEVRIVSDAEERSSYNKELSSYQQTLSQLTTEIQGFKSEESRNQLFLGSNTNGFGAPENADPTQAGDALLDGADNIQDKTQQALANTTTMIAESKATGMVTLEELGRQRQQIDNVDQDVNRLEDNLNTADKLIKTFGKRMATDKLIQAFACLNIVLVVGVVIYLIVKGGMPGNEEIPPENPNDVESNLRALRGNW